uniref:Uncharacterized protein n=1 Tax=Arion vulgaris TaxID=1028688 RepID=A0A0B6ZUF3_9EUPU
MGNWFCRTKNIKIIILGLDASGKTTMLYHMKLGEFVSTIPTIGHNIETVHLDGIDITCWDLSSRGVMSKLWQVYYPNTQGFVFMIDSSRRDELDDSLNEFLTYVLRHEHTINKVIMIVANKQDLKGALSAQEIEDRLLERSLASRQHTMFVTPCSALDKKQVNETFSFFAHQICLNEKGKAKSGLITVKEQQEYWNQIHKADTETTFKLILHNSIQYFKSYFE